MNRRRTLGLLAGLVLVVAALAPTTAGAWAPAASATIQPGSDDVHRGRPVHLELRLHAGGSNVYLGQAAHCSGTGGATETNGCDSGSLPVGTPVEIDGASQARDHGLQLVADDAGARGDRSRHLRSTTTSRWSGWTRPTSAR